ncbi:hypothetical protein BD410DRAFT_573060 [Rickenella mellea]|uniref:Zn(2)-C6 fungal-type domain-containing protein n=1 Tax=Rickenella mellea TaxID=50990 RepID=A0A4Y7QGJ4_9AGAM|nr:hypothetical protein BD410DRAFT_573060 [Rickenella mellea]
MREQLPSPLPDINMAQSLPYPVHYMPQHTQYYIAPLPQHPHVPGQMHLVGPTTVRTEQPQRKRPKYTRSKTGCLTCRMKKIKCDEAKPSCQRCTHGQRECTWPENLPAKKKVPSRKSSAADERPSPVESSSHVSDTSCASRELPTHAHDVAVHDSMTNGIERRHSEPLLHSFSISPTSGRRKT